MNTTSYLNLKIGEFGKIPLKTGAFANSVSGTLEKEKSFAWSKDIQVIDLLSSLIGSAEFSIRQQQAIHKIFNEFKHRINFNMFNDYLHTNKDFFLPTAPSRACLEMFWLLTHAFNEFEAEVTKNMLPSNILIHTESVGSLNINLNPSNSKLEGESGRIISKLNISVFKNRENDPSNGKQVINLLASFLKTNILEVDTTLINVLLSYSVKFRGPYDYNTGHEEIGYLRKTAENKVMAQKYLKLFKEPKELRIVEIQKAIAKFMELGFDYEEALMKSLIPSPIIESVAINICKDLNISAVEFVNGYTTICRSMGIEYSSNNFDVMKNALEVIQVANSAFGEFNVTLDLIKETNHKKQYLLKKAVLLAANFSNDEAEVVKLTIQYFIELALLDVMTQKHQESLLLEIQTVVDEYNSNKEMEELKQINLEMSSQLQILSLELERLKNRQSDDYEKDLHKEYGQIIRELTKKIDSLENEINRISIDTDKKEGNQFEPKEELLDPSKILKNKKIIFVGNPLSEVTTRRFKHLGTDIKFIDGTLRSNSIEPIQLIGIDALITQYEFIPHTVAKFEDLAKRYNVPVIPVRGTNFDKWTKQIASALAC